MVLNELGWNTELEKYFKNNFPLNLKPARVLLQHRNKYKLFTENGEIWARAAGKMFYKFAGRGELPAVGDWVVYEHKKGKELDLIKGLFPRKSKLSRKTKGLRFEEQVIAANIDIVFVISGLDGEYNLQKIERFLVIVKQGGAQPVIILNKADRNKNSHKIKKEVEKNIKNVPVIIMSAIKEAEIDKISSYLNKGETIAFIGASGVGKSTIINILAGAEIQKIQDVRSDNKGRHTTTRREMLIMPGGYFIIDTPGLREIQLWQTGDGIEDSFDDILLIAQDCFYNNCTHKHEPKCAVKKAVENSELELRRVQHFHKVISEREQLDTQLKRSTSYDMREKKFQKRKENLDGEIDFE